MPGRPPYPEAEEESMPSPDFGDGTGGRSTSLDTPETDWKANVEMSELATQLGNAITLLELHMGLETTLGVAQQGLAFQLESKAYVRGNLTESEKTKIVKESMALWHERLEKLVDAAKGIRVSLVCEDALDTCPPAPSDLPHMKSVCLGHSILPWIRAKRRQYRSDPEFRGDEHVQLYEDLPLDLSCFIERPVLGGPSGFMTLWAEALDSRLFMSARIGELQKIQRRGQEMMKKGCPVHEKQGLFRRFASSLH